MQVAGQWRLLRAANRDCRPKGAPRVGRLNAGKETVCFELVRRRVRLSPAVVRARCRFRLPATRTSARTVGRCHAGSTGDAESQVARRISFAASSDQWQLESSRSQRTPSPARASGVKRSAGKRATGLYTRDRPFAESQAIPPCRGAVVDVSRGRSTRCRRPCQP